MNKFNNVNIIASIINKLMAHSKNYLIEICNNNIYVEKYEKGFSFKKYLMSNRILIILFILYLKFQISISNNPIITLQINNIGNNTIIYKDFKEYLLEVYINDINMTNIDNSYNFTEENNTVKFVEIFLKLVFQILIHLISLIYLKHLKIVKN